MKARRIATAVVTACSALALAACGATSSTSTSAAGAAGNAGTGTVAVASGAQSSDMAARLADDTTSHAKSDDVSYDAASAVTIALKDGASTASGAGVTISGDTVTITTKGTYVLSGTLTNGQVLVDSSVEGKVRLVLSGATVTNASGAAIDVKAADEVVVVLAAGTTNTLTDGSGYDTSGTDAPDAALFSMADLTIGGTGTLVVHGRTADGIATKDGLAILAGTITVDAVDDGIRGKDYVDVEGGTITVTSGQDGLKSTNETDDTVGWISVKAGSVTVTAGDDGMHAEGDLAISGGTVTVTKSTEGIEGANIAVSGGSVIVTASDDGVNVSNGSGSTQGNQGGGMQDDGSLLAISGGTIVVNSGGDGLDSNGSIEMSGGLAVVSGPTTNGNGALDSNGGINVSGGSILAAGSAGMAESPEAASSQGWVAVKLSQQVAAGQVVSVVSGDTVIASYRTGKTTGSIILTTAGITKGSSYDIYVGGSLSGDQVGGYSPGGSISGATKVSTATAGQAIFAGMGGGMHP